jgi:hypothetical protein
MRIKLCFILVLLLSTLCSAEQKSVRLVNDAEAKTLEAIFPNSEIIKEQSFFITINGFKNVYFVSITHNSDAGEYLTFYLIKNKSVLLELPMTLINDYIMKDVEAVSFLDMNKDGYSDITIIVSCLTEAGDQGPPVPYYVATILINNRQGGFANHPVVDDDIRTKLNEDENFCTIKDIAKYVDEKYNRQPY